MTLIRGLSRAAEIRTRDLLTPSRCKRDRMQLRRHHAATKIRRQILRRSIPSTRTSSCSACAVQDLRRRRVGIGVGAPGRASGASRDVRSRRMSSDHAVTSGMSTPRASSTPSPRSALQIIVTSARMSSEGSTPARSRHSSCASVAMSIRGTIVSRSRSRTSLSARAAAAASSNKRAQSRAFGARARTDTRRSPAASAPSRLQEALRRRRRSSRQRPQRGGRPCLGRSRRSRRCSIRTDARCHG